MFSVKRERESSLDNLPSERLSLNLGAAILTAKKQDEKCESEDQQASTNVSYSCGFEFKAAAKV